MASSKRWPGTKRHFHTYEWRKSKSGVGRFTNGMWKCADPSCNHYMPTYLVDDLLPGKSSYCVCGAEMVLTPDNMKQAIENAQIDELTGILTGHPLCDMCLGNIKPFDRSVEETNEYIDYRTIPILKLSRIGTTESMNKWCEACQMSHKDGEHVS